MLCCFSAFLCLQDRKEINYLQKETDISMSQTAALDFMVCYQRMKCFFFSNLSTTGDAERMKVVAFRLGASMNLHYQWFLRSKPVGGRVIRILNHGDAYVMSEIATGNNWKKKKILTLRHAAGADKFTTIKEAKASGEKKTAKKVRNAPIKERAESKKGDYEDPQNGSKKRARNAEK